MTSQIVRVNFSNVLIALAIAAAAAVWQAAAAGAATYAAMVVDARNGEVLFSRNANARLHPASLTKMMTMYVAFEAVENGEIGLDDKFRISRRAASEPPSKLGLRPGSRIKFRYLLRAAVVRSANDAATAIAEAVSGSVEAFARRMNRTAKAMGMTHTNFKNAHGLTQNGHLSSARDMTILGRHLIYDFNDYYNMYSRPSTFAGLKTVRNTNRRLLNGYRGADGIKTGYTRAAGYNLVASAKRGRVRVIATVFGGKSVASRTKHVMELLDKGFARAKENVRLKKPALPIYASRSPALEMSVIPMWRPDEFEDAGIVAGESVGVSGEQGSIQDDADQRLGDAVSDGEAIDDNAVLSHVPLPRPPALAASSASTGDPSSGESDWRITVGKFPTSYQAEKKLIAAGLIVHRSMPGVEKSIEATKYFFRPSFINLSKSQAETACRILVAREIECEIDGPGG